MRMSHARSYVAVLVFLVPPVLVAASSRLNVLQMYELRNLCHHGALMPLALQKRLSDFGVVPVSDSAR